jgi:hypothetical protein
VGHGKRSAHLSTDNNPAPDAVNQASYAIRVIHGKAFSRRLNHGFAVFGAIIYDK